MEGRELETIVENWKSRAISRAVNSEKGYIQDIYSLVKSPNVSGLMHEKFYDLKLSASIGSERAVKIFDEILDVIVDVYKKNKNIPYQELSDCIEKSLEKIEKPKIPDFVGLLFGTSLKESINKILVSKR